MGLTQTQLVEFMSRCDRAFADTLTKLADGGVPVACIATSVMAFAASAGAQAGVRREDFLESASEFYDRAAELAGIKPS